MSTPPPANTPFPELVSYLEGLSEPHILFDLNYRIIAANTAYRQQFGHARGAQRRGDRLFQRDDEQPVERARHDIGAMA
jgi:hypothetical protein